MLTFSESLIPIGGGRLTNTVEIATVIAATIAMILHTICKQILQAQNISATLKFATLI